MRTFSEKQYLSWKRRLAIVLARVGKSEEAEDAVNDLIVGMLEGKHQHQTIDQFAIDYLRKRSGNKRLRGYSQRQKLLGAASIESFDVERQLGFDPRRDVDARIDLDRMRELAGEDEDGQVLKLYYFEGLSAREIGDRFGVTESWICQRLKRAESRLSKRIARPRSKFEREAAREVAEILRVAWQGLEFETHLRMAFEEPREMERGCLTRYEEWIA